MSTEMQLKGKEIQNMCMSACKHATVFTRINAHMYIVHCTRHTRKNAKNSHKPANIDFHGNQNLRRKKKFQIAIRTRPSFIKSKILFHAKQPLFQQFALMVGFYFQE